MRKIRKCKLCGKDTRNPVYCSSKCSVSDTNKLRKNTNDHICIDCGGELLNKKSVRCMNCYRKHVRKYDTCDNKITELYDSGIGCREVARQCGVPASRVYRIIKRTRGKLRDSDHYMHRLSVNNGISEIKFTANDDKLRKAAEDYLKFLCRISGYKFLDPDESESYDLMVDFGGGWKKVQVKSSCCNNGKKNYYFKLIKCRTNTKEVRKIKYTESDVDYFFLMDKNLNCWLIPFNKLCCKVGVVPGDVFSGFKVVLNMPGYSKGTEATLKM